MSTDVKVLFIVGWGRSGTTVLDNVLGEIEGFFSAGELAHLWERGLVQNRHCGCGVPFRACEIWQAVLARAFGDAWLAGVGIALLLRRRMRRGA